MMLAGAALEGRIIGAFKPGIFSPGAFSDESVPAVAEVDVWMMVWTCTGPGKP